MSAFHLSDIANLLPATKIVNLKQPFVMFVCYSNKFYNLPTLLVQRKSKYLF